VRLLTPWFDTPPGPTWLEYDGNLGSLVHSSRAPFARPCAHFHGINDLGDPWYSD
jgi:hypothetical protein